jgi:hypothetical protein
VARPALATVEDLGVLLAQPIEEDSPAYAQAKALLAHASAIVRAFAGRTWLNEAEDALEGVPADIPGVVAGMVERATRNPAGITQEQAGPYARSFGPEAASRLYLNQWDKLVIRAAIGADTSGLSVLHTTRGDIETTPLTDPRDAYPTETLTSLDSLLGGT